MGVSMLGGAEVIRKDFRDDLVASEKIMAYNDK